ncbi:MAG: hypothetical protein WC903_06660 [Candidatus Margulisiibacteriota bacterium]
MINKSFLGVKAEQVHAKWGRAGLLWWLGLAGIISLISRQQRNKLFASGWKEPFDKDTFRLTRPRISDKNVLIETGGAVDEDIYPLA